MAELHRKSKDEERYWHSVVFEEVGCGCVTKERWALMKGLDLEWSGWQHRPGGGFFLSNLRDAFDGILDTSSGVGVLVAKA